ERLLMTRRIGERQFRLLSFRDVFNYTDKIVRPAIGLADSADGLVDPDCGSVFADEAFLGGVLIEFASSNFLGLGELDSKVGGMGNFPHGDLAQGFLRIAHDFAE